MVARSEQMFYPLDCPHCGAPLRADGGPARPVTAHLLRLAAAVTAEARAAGELALALGMSTDAVTAGMRRCERAGLVTHTMTTTPHRGGRRYLYRATDLLRAYASAPVAANEPKRAKKTKKGSTRT